MAEPLLRIIGSRARCLHDEALEFSWYSMQKASPSQICFRASRSFCLCSFFTRMMPALAPFHRISLSVSVQCTGLQWRLLPKIFLHCYSIWKCGYQPTGNSIPCAVIWKWSDTTVSANLGGQVSMREPLTCATFSETRDTKQPFIPVINHHGREVSLEKNSGALAKSCTHYQHTVTKQEEEYRY
jgi:hypothetical protein